MAIEKQNYIINILREDHLLNIDWYYTFLTIINKDVKSKYLRIENDKFEVLVNNIWEELVENNKPVTSVPIFNIKYPIKLPKGSLTNLDTDIETTLGRVIINKVLLDYNFNNKIPYINNKVEIKDIEKIIAAKMKTDEISVKEYVNFADSVNFLRGLSRITNVSATPKNIVAPPGIDEEKKRIELEFTAKYGEAWKNNRTLIVAFQNELKQIDNDWLKDDPSYGKLVSGKIKDNARVKMFLTFGPEVGFDKSGEKVVFVENSLQDGYPKDKTQLSAMFNSARSASYDRGKETQKGGAAAKDILRASSGYKVVGEDCGTNKGFKIMVTKENKDILKGRTLVNNASIDNIDSYLGKVIEIRSPMYCKSHGTTYCKKCVGSNMVNYQDGISLALLSVSQTLLTISLKAMHNTQVKLMDYNILEGIR